MPPNATKNGSEQPSTLLLDDRHPDSSSSLLERMSEMFNPNLVTCYLFRKSKFHLDINMIPFMLTQNLSIVAVDRWIMLIKLFY